MHPHHADHEYRVFTAEFFNKIDPKRALTYKTLHGSGDNLSFFRIEQRLLDEKGGEAFRFLYWIGASLLASVFGQLGWVALTRNDLGSMAAAALVGDHLAHCRGRDAMCNSDGNDCRCHHRRNGTSKFHGFTMVHFGRDRRPYTDLSGDTPMGLSHKVQ